jgi:hypothetical protein
VTVKSIVWPFRAIPIPNIRNMMCGLPQCMHAEVRGSGMTEEKALAVAQGSQGRSRDKGERGETCKPRTKKRHSKITRFNPKISIKG